MSSRNALASGQGLAFCVSHESFVRVDGDVCSRGFLLPSFLLRFSSSDRRLFTFRVSKEKLIEFSWP